METGELAAGRQYFERAEQCLVDAGAPLPARVPALRGRALAHYLAGELRYAVYLLESTLDELNRGGLHDPDALLLLYASAIGPYMDMGAHARAAQAAELALSLAPSAGDPALVARTAPPSPAPCSPRAASPTPTPRWPRRPSCTARCNCAPSWPTATCWMRGYVCAQNGELPRAEEEMREALGMLSANRAALYSSQVAVELADVLHRRGKSEEAADLLHGVLDDLSERGAVHAAGAHRLLGIIAEDARDTEAAEEHYVRALSLLERAGAAGDLAYLFGSRRPAAPHRPRGGGPGRAPTGLGHAPHRAGHHHPGRRPHSRRCSPARERPDVALHLGPARRWASVSRPCRPRLDVRVASSAGWPRLAGRWRLSASSPTRTAARSTARASGAGGGAGVRRSRCPTPRRPPSPAGPGGAPDSGRVRAVTPDVPVTGAAGGPAPRSARTCPAVSRARPASGPGRRRGTR
ncbi:hypothetical protein STENM36S_00268 [Streptomyces tendae]